MQKLIKIEANIIGAEEVNSVNARDIHTYLEVKTRFNDWIQRAIKKYDFVEGEDFLLTQKRVSGNNAVVKEYIVTLDMAKELSMLENNKKGKETRKYFIQMEKEAVAKLQAPSDSNAVMLEMIKNQQRLTDAVLDVINTQQGQNKVIMDYVTATFDGLKNIGQIKIDEKALMPQYLDSRDRKKLRDAIQTKAKEVAKDMGVSVSTISPAIWIELKSFFDVDDYQDIHKSQMKDVMHFVTFWEPKKGQAKETKQKPTHEIILDEEGNSRVIPIV